MMQRAVAPHPHEPGDEHALLAEWLAFLQKQNAAKARHAAAAGTVYYSLDAAEIWAAAALVAGFDVRPPSHGRGYIAER